MFYDFENVLRYAAEIAAAAATAAATAAAIAAALLQYEKSVKTNENYNFVHT